MSALIRLNHLFVQGARFGVDLIDPYGPLQFVARNLYWPELLVPRLLGRILHAVGLGLLVWDLLKATGRQRLLTAIASSLLLVWAIQTGQDSGYEILFLLIVIAHLFNGRPTAGTITGMASAAVMSLVKFPLFLLFAAMLVVMTTIDIVRRRPPILLIAGIAYFAGLWLVAGQMPGDVLPWISTSFALSSGFNDAMSFGFLEPDRVLKLLAFIGSMAVFTASLWYSIRRHAPFVESAVVTLFFSLWCFVVFKHGIVRHDAHAAHTGASFALAAALLALILWSNSRSWIRQSMLVLLAGTFVVNVWIVRAYLGEGVGPAAFVQWLGRSIQAMVMLPEIGPTLASTHAAGAANYRSMVGPLPTDGTIDQWPDNAAVAIFSGAEYRPRPMPFAYSVYSPSISRRNSAFLDSDRAATTMVFQVGSIDGRLPTFDDSLTWRAVLRNYNFESVVGNHAVLRHRTAARVERLSPIRGHDAAWNETIAVDDTLGSMLWASVDIEKTLLGRVNSVLFKGPPINMSIMTRDGQTRSFRLVPDMMRVGFLLSPLIAEQENFLNLYGQGNGFDGNEVVGVRFDLPRSLAPLYGERINMRLESLVLEPGLNDGKVLRQPTPVRMSMSVMTALKNSVPPTIGVRFIKVPEDANALLSHAPNQLVVDIPRGRRKLSAGLGMDPGSYASINDGDGVTFAIVVETPAGAQEIFRRHLNPGRIADDQGLQHLNIVMPEQATRVRFVTEPGPAGNTAWDWSYWSNVSFAE